MFEETASLDDRFLSALMNHRECIVSAREVDKLPPEYLDTEEQRKIYRNILKHFEQYKGKSMLTPDVMKRELEKRGIASIEIARVYAMYNSIRAINTTANEYPVYVKDIKERYYKRLLTKSVHIANELTNKEKDPVAAANELLKTTAQIKMLSSEDRVVRSALSERAPSLKEKYLFTKNHQNEAMGLYTGFYKLDQLTWGLQPGEVLVVAGPTGGGKSVTLVAMAAYIYNGMRFCNCEFQLYKHSQICPACGADVSKDESVYHIRGKNVAYVSIEMPEEDCLRRFSASSLGLRSKDIQRGDLGDSDEQVYFEYLDKVTKSKEPGFFMIDVPRGVDVDFINSELDRIEATNGIKLDVVIIDYLSLMTPRGSKGGVKEGDWKEQESIAAEIHELARNRRIPVITAVQTTSIRSLKNETLRYGTHRVARAEGIAHNVNIIIQIEDVVEEDKKKSEQTGEETLAITYHVIKNRDGAKGVIQMQKDFSKMQIYHMVEYSYDKTE